MPSINLTRFHQYLRDVTILGLFAYQFDLEREDLQEVMNSAF